MATTKKTEYKDDQTANNDFLNSILGKREPATDRPETVPADTGSKANDPEKVLVNFKMNREALERLRTYCKENDMTLTAGIKRAIRQMLENEWGQ